jgi:hypothetical protein
MPEPLSLDPDLIRAARQQLTSRYATGVEQVLWDMHKFPMHDLDAVARVLEAPGAAESAPDDRATATDIGAAFLLLMVARLDADRMEAALFDRALEMGMEYEQIAAVLDLPGSEAARRRHREVRARAQTATALGPRPFDEPISQRRPRAQAGRQRAGEAGDRLRQAARQARPPDPGAAAAGD